MIEINIENVAASAASVVRLSGEIDATTAAVVQQNVLPLTTPGCRLVMDLTNVAYMSSAGLRMLLSLYRNASSKQGKIVLVGLTEELRDTMSMTGFLGYFSLEDTVEAGLKSF